LKLIKRVRQTSLSSCALISFRGAERHTKKKHQPHGLSVRPVLPPCTLRGSNPGHPVNISSYYMVLQSVIWCYPMPRII
jgi:hypothetical protein